MGPNRGSKRRVLRPVIVKEGFEAYFVPATYLGGGWSHLFFQGHSSRTGMLIISKRRLRILKGTTYIL